MSDTFTAKTPGALRETHMARETRESPLVVSRQLERNHGLCSELARRFQKSRPRLIATCARGSSDHAAMYGKYLLGIELGLPVLSMAPSIGSIYGRAMDLRDTLFLVVSQSGKSPDLVACAQWARDNGAFVLGMVNEDGSPVQDVAHETIPLRAGPEQSVAATKSYIAALCALAHLAALVSGSRELARALEQLPGHLEQALALSWSGAVEAFADAESLYTVGRGLGYGVCLEAALKLKETSSLHAEGVSGAELLHGPLALVRRRSRILMFSQEDETAPGMKELAELLLKKQAKLFLAKEDAPESVRLPVVPGMHPATAPLAMIASFYSFANELALARGLDPDAPPSLKKVTETL